MVKNQLKWMSLLKTLNVSKERRTDKIENMQLIFIRFPIMIIEVMTIGSNTIFLNNPYFVKLGLIGLFINSLLSSVIPIPTELTISGLLLQGQSKIAIFIILVSGSILGGFIAYLRLWRYWFSKTVTEKTK